MDMNAGKRYPTAEHALPSTGGASIFSDLLGRWESWIVSQVDPVTGAICDPYNSRPLHFQYHYAAFILGRVCANEPSEDPLITRVLQYLSSLPDRERRITDEFNAYLLSLAHWVVRASAPEFALKIAMYLSRLPRPDADELIGRNRNFLFMFRCAANYTSRSCGHSMPKPLKERIDAAAAASVTDSGWLIDSPSFPHPGFASFVYHIKIATTLLCDGLLNGTPGAFDSGRRAIDRLLDYTDVSDACCYGRSQSSLFGYANLYAALTLIAAETGDAGYLRVRAETARVIERLELNDGEFALNPARDNRRRPGFDPYMHAIVYNAYAWGMMRFAENYATKRANGRTEIAVPEDGLAAREVIECRSIPDASAPSETSCVYDADIGFLAYRSAAFYTFLSLKGDRGNAKYWFDPRYQSFVPIILHAANGAVCPPIPVDYRGMMRLAVRSSLRDRLTTLWGSLRFFLTRMRYENFLDLAGLLPSFVLPDKIKLCAGTQLEIDNLTFASGGGLNLRSRFIFDAAMPRWYPGRNRLDRINARFREAAATMDVSMRLDETSIRYDFVFSPEAAALNATLTHFNFRLPANMQTTLAADGLSLSLDHGVKIHHSMPLHATVRRVVQGSTGPIQWLTCSRPLASCDRSLTTEIRFAPRGSSEPQ